MDAINILVCRKENFLSPGQRLLFTTSDTLHVPFGYKKNDSDTRATLIPIMLLNLGLLVKQGEIDNKLDYLKDALEEVIVLGNRLNAVPQGSLPKNDLMERTLYFKQRVLDKLFRLTDAPTKEQKIKREEMLDLIANDNVFREKVEDARENIVRQITAFTTNNPIFSADIEWCNSIIEKDPIAKRIISRW